MGSPLPDGTWDGFTGAYYTGAGGTWEPIWLFVSIGLCGIALFSGLAHEKLAHRRMKREHKE